MRRSPSGVSKFSLETRKSPEENSKVMAWASDWQLLLEEMTLMRGRVESLESEVSIVKGDLALRERTTAVVHLEQKVGSLESIISISQQTAEAAKIAVETLTERVSRVTSDLSRKVDTSFIDESIAALLNAKSQDMYNALMLRMGDLPTNIHLYERQLNDISRRIDTADYRLIRLIETLVGIEESDARRVGGGYVYGPCLLFDRATQDELLSIIGAERRSTSIPLQGTLRPSQKLGSSGQLEHLQDMVHSLNYPRHVQTSPRSRTRPVSAGRIGSAPHWHFRT